jgi:predicted nucleic acid-binding protein
VRTFVLDASVGLAWFIDDPAPSYAIQIRNLMASGKGALVPSLWVLEMANGLLMAGRRGKLTAAEMDHGLGRLEALITAGIDVDAVVPTIREAFAPAHAHQLTTYDAVYLELARREGLPLATLDKSLRTAAAKIGIRAMS